MGESKLTVTGINHVVLHVAELERSRKFYIDILGFEDRHLQIGPNMRASFLRCGSQGLDLFEVSTGEVFGGKEMNHLALCVDAEDLDGVTADLVRSGIAVSERTPRNTVFISDPDGHRLEILPRAASERAGER